MIQANELRIGNWVNNNEENYPITSATIVGLERGDLKVEPITLTEEWLVMFGFEKEVKEGCQGEFIVYWLNRITYNTNHGWWFGRKLTVQPKYVHQLQNLYFALTGTELSIKEE